jgi:hypothetical protein
MRSWRLLLPLAAARAAEPWTEAPASRAGAAKKLAQPSVKPPVYTVDLALPAEQRWTHIAKAYKSKVPAIVAYFDAVVPKWAMPLIEAVGAKMKGYFRLYGGEMAGLADALEASPGLIVLMNLVYQVEGLGLNCSTWNVTGPTRKDDPGCMDVDPDQKWCYCHEAHTAGAGPSDDGFTYLSPKLDEADGPGLCTSVVAQASDGSIIHGRNLDWNLPAVLRSLVVDVDFVNTSKSTEKLFRMTTAVGFVGGFNGMAYRGRGGDGWSVTIDARGKGGKPLDNMLQALLVPSLTPCQHLRHVLERTSDFEQGLSALSTTPLIDEIYYIVAGTKAAEGAVVTRGREKAVDVWRLDLNEPDGWFRLQTNYDHWNPVPAADDRRNPGVTMMKAVGQAGLSTASMWHVITSFPVFNHHTDLSLIAIPQKQIFNATVWMGGEPDFLV